MYPIIFIVKFGEMDLSPTVYWSIILTGVAFILCFILSSIPLAKNIQRITKNQDKVNNK
tara:strand:- start:1488 stop:1664 length:177 start_codon:yes stop_codon:yes gene_type:complete